MIDILVFQRKDILKTKADIPAKRVLQVFEDEVLNSFGVKEKDGKRSIYKSAIFGIIRGELFFNYNI